MDESRSIPSTSAGFAGDNSAQQPDMDEDDEIVELDPSGRFCRYRQEVGQGRFKFVFKGFDEKQGIDVAWSKIHADRNHLTQEQMHRICEEMSLGLTLDHPNIIKCYMCWEDPEQNCINLITEYFTSGNLRDYRQKHKHLGIKAVKKWAKQILMGLLYLHQRTPVVIHGDLRADKIYINGHSGEIKIGDLGLATLIPKRFPPGVLPTEQEGQQNQYTEAVDVFALGLCLLELVCNRRIEPTALHHEWQQLVAAVDDDYAKDFIGKCLAAELERPAVEDLLNDFFLIVPRAGGKEVGRATSTREMALSTEELESPPADISCEVGTVRGEDYSFQFSGKMKDSKLHFRLHMQYDGDEPDDGETHTSRIIDFIYDPEVDTPDAIASEIGSEFDLSSTDRDICAAALKEWLAKELPDSSN